MFTRVNVRRASAAVLLVAVLSLTSFWTVMSSDENDAAGLDFSGDFYYNQLTEREQGLYRQMYAAAMNFDSEFNSGISDGSLSDLIVGVYQALRYDHPELFMLDPNSCTYYPQNGVVKFEYTVSKAEFSTKLATYNATFDSAVINETTRKTAVQSINDWIKDNTAYDYDATGETAYAHTIMGVFDPSLHKAVCEGYALAFKLFCNYYGIPCICIVGDGIPSGGDPSGHMWNYVRMDNKWYAMDVTWNDTADTNAYTLAGADTVIGTRTFSECHIEDDISKRFDLGTTLPLQSAKYLGVNGGDTAPICDPPYVSTYFYDCLTLLEKSIYDKIVAGVLNFQSEIDTGCSDHDTIMNAYRALQYDRPDLGIIVNFHSSTTTLGTVLKLTFYVPEDEREEHYLEWSSSILQALIPLEKELSNCTSDYQKVLAIHDFLVSNCVYDQSSSNCRNLYGTLVEHKAVCEGYARTFQYLCSMHGVQSIIIRGDGYHSAGDTPEGHMWNAVLMNDGVWYDMDVTWDDPLVNGHDSGDVYYDYFLVGSDTTNSKGLKFSESHVVDLASDYTPYGFVLPAVSATDYYIRPGEVLTVQIPCAQFVYGYDYTGVVDLADMETVLDQLQGVGSAIVFLDNVDVKFVLSPQRLGQMIDYMSTHSALKATFVVHHETTTVHMMFFDVPADIYGFDLFLGTTETKLSEIADGFDMQVSIGCTLATYEVLTFLVFAWDVSSPLTPVPGSSYADGYVSFTIDNLNATYVVGSTPIKGVPVEFVIAGILLILIIIGLLVRHHRHKYDDDY